MTERVEKKELAMMLRIFLAAVLASAMSVAVAQEVAHPASNVGAAKVQDPCDRPQGLVAAASTGDANARIKSAKCYLKLGDTNLNFGPGKAARPDDNARAISWYEKAAALGNVDADRTLCAIYQGYDDTRSFKFCHAGALLGDPMSESLTGDDYWLGTGVPKDVPEGAVWIYKAAKQGDAWSEKYFNQFSLEMYQALGDAYAFGDGVAQDYAEAFKWYSKAAAKGDPMAEHNLATAYGNGQGVDINPAAAADWHYKAGIGFLKLHARDRALLEAQLIKALQNQYADLPNGFLANKLIAQIYAPQVSQHRPQAAPAATLSEGTGWPVSGGFIVTNHHVVAGAQEIWIRMANGTKMWAGVAADDPNNDLVLLKVENPNALPPALPLASSPAAVGEPVFALGYPQPDIMGNGIKLTDGVINALAGPNDDPRLYQTNTEIQSGNSGSPLLDMQGQVVGVMEGSLDAAKILKLTGDVPQNVNYAIKIVYLKALMQSVQPAGEIRVLPTQAASLEPLDKRIAPSVVMVFAKTSGGQ